MLNDDPGIDLILLDVQMPDMNGYEVLEHLKSNNCLRHIPVIFVTACDFLNVLDYIKTLNDDAVSCIPKPLDVSTLLETIDHFLCLPPHYLDNARIAYQMQKNAWVFSHTS